MTPCPAPILPAAGHGAAEGSGYRFRPCQAQRSIPKPWALLGLGCACRSGSMAGQIQIHEP
jgi:hypothetical protein